MKTKRNTKFLVTVSFLSALALLLQFITEFPIIFIAPDFMKIDLSDIPAVIGAVTLGPVAGILIQLIKNLLHAITLSQSVGIGELANFLIGSALIIPIGLICRKKTNIYKFIFSSIIGIIFMTFSAAIFNYFVLIPFYLAVMGIQLNYIIDLASKINSNVINLTTYIIFCVIPFNLFKGAVVIFISTILYKLLEKPLFRKLSN